MNEHRSPVEVIEPETASVFSLGQICTLLELRSDVVCEWVEDGIVRPQGRSLSEWRFTNAELERARRARRLQHDLELDSASLPLVLELLGEVQRLRRRLRMLEERYFE
jgi:chaperone modulatory protein CbpM